MSEARLCRDPLCNEPISLGKVITNFEGTGEKGLLPLKEGEKVYIYAKEPDKTPELWYGESDGKGGYFPKEHVEEFIVYEPNPTFVVSKDILENSEDSGGTDNKDESPSNPQSNEDTPKTTSQEQNQENSEQSEKENSEMDENVQDALKSSIEEKMDSNEAKKEEQEEPAKDEPVGSDQSSSEGLNSKGEKKLPQFIPGEYMSLPREELMKVLEERQKILNAQANEGDVRNEEIEQQDKKTAFQPAVHVPDDEDKSRNQELPLDVGQEGKRSLDEVVTNVQDNLKAVVEEDLNRLGKLNDESKMNNEEKKENGDMELSSEDGLGIRGINGEPVESKKIQEENRNQIPVDGSDSTNNRKSPGELSKDKEFPSKGKAILFHRRKLREKAEQDHFERTHGRRNEGNSNGESNKKQESAREEKNGEETPNDKMEAASEKNEKSGADNARTVDPSNEKTDDPAQEDEIEDEDEEYYEEVEPLKVTHKENETSKVEAEKDALKEKEHDKKDADSTAEKISSVEKNEVEETHTEIKEKTRLDNKDGEQTQDKEEKKEPLVGDQGNDNKEEKTPKNTNSEEEIKKQQEEEAKKQREEESKRQQAELVKRKEEEERQTRLRLLQEERKRVQALDEQARILLQKKQEYEKKMEDEKLRRQREKLKKEEEREERIRLEVEKRLKAMEEEKRKKAEEEKKRQQEEEEKKIEEEKQRIQEEKKRKEEENKRIEEEMRRLEEEQKKKTEDENKKKDQEVADKLKEEMEIEAALKNRLQALAKDNEKTQEEDMGKKKAEQLKEKNTNVGEEENKNDKSVKEEGSGKQRKGQKGGLLKNKIKNMKMKAKITRNKNAGRKTKGMKTIKSKKKLYDVSEIHLDQDSCLSIPDKKRMSCGIDLSEDECHDDGCCFDEDAPPEIQCFYPPSEPVDRDDDDDVDDFDEFEDTPPKNRKNKRRNGVKKQQKIPNGKKEVEPKQQRETKTTAENTGKAETGLPGAAVVNPDNVGINTRTSTISPTPVQAVTRTTLVTTQGNQDATDGAKLIPSEYTPPTKTTSQDTQVTTQATQLNQDTTATDTTSSVITPSPSTGAATQTTAPAVGERKADSNPAPQQHVNNGTPADQQKQGVDVAPTTEEGGATAPPNQNRIKDDQLQPKVTYSDDKAFDRRVPPKVPPTLPTVLQSPLDEKSGTGGEQKMEPVPEEKPSDTPTNSFPTILKEPTLPPTSAAETVSPELKNRTKKAKRKSYGIIKGFWSFHEFLAIKIIEFGQPLKSTVGGIMACVGLGQVFNDICQDLSTAPPLVIGFTMAIGSIGVLFILWSCIAGFTSVDAAKGPSPRDLFKTYEARIRILEEEIEVVETSNKELQVKAEHAVEEKHHSDEAANTARKSLEQTMMKIKQNENELQHLQEIINVSKQELQAVSEEIEQKDEEIERMQQVNEEYKEAIQVKESEIHQMKEEVIDFKKSKALMNEEIEELKDRLDGKEEEQTKLEDNISEWKEKYEMLQQSLDDQALRSSQMQEQYEFKCNEVEVLQDCLLQIKGEEKEEDEEGEPLSEEEKDKLRSERLQEMLDASKSKTVAKIMKEENLKYKSELEETKTAKEALEEKIQDLEHNLSQAKLNEEKAYLDFREKDIELTALRKYFKDTESELHRKLTAEESAREATENKLKTELSKATADSKDLNTYKKLYADINEEIQRVKGNVGHQVAAVEERAHNNWLKYRTVERELEEVKRERDALRRRMYALEKEKNRPGSSASGKSSDSADGVRAESPIRGPPPPGHPAAPRVPEHHSPVPMPPPMHHPMYGPPVMPMGYGPPPPPGRYGPPPPPQGYMGTPPPGRNGPPPPPSGRRGSGSHTPNRDERDERDRRDSRGYGPNEVRDSRRSGHRSVSPPNGTRNHIESPNSFNKPVSSSTPGDPRQGKLGKMQNAMDNDRAPLRDNYDSRPIDGPPPYVPHPPGPPMGNSPMMRPPMRPPYGPPMGPPPMGSPMRPPYGPPRAPPMGSPMGPPRPSPAGQSPVPGPPPMGSASGPNAYRRVSGNRPPTNSSTS